jgi:hypothetical protein
MTKVTKRNQIPNFLKIPPFFYIIAVSVAVPKVENPIIHE